MIEILNNNSLMINPDAQWSCWSRLSSEMAYQTIRFHVETATRSLIQPVNYLFRYWDYLSLISVLIIVEWTSRRWPEELDNYLRSLHDKTLYIHISFHFFSLVSGKLPVHSWVCALINMTCESCKRDVIRYVRVSVLVWMIRKWIS